MTIPPLNPEKIKNIEASLDDTVAIGIPKPASKEEEEALVRQFLSGLKKLFEKENNWTFLQPLHALHGALRQMPDLFRRLPRL